MSYLGNIDKNTLRLEIKQRPGIYVQPFQTIFVRSQNGKVYLFIDDKLVEMSTIIAHKIGLEIQRNLKNVSRYEMFSLVINGEPIDLMPDIAKKVSVGLLRKADQADDWQLKRRKLA